MVVVLAPAVDKICESFTQNPLIWTQVNPTFLYFMGIHKEFIVHASEFESDFGEGKHGWACVAMGNQKYTLHSQIAFSPPCKPGRTTVYPTNPIHGNIAVTDQQYQNNIHDYYRVKNTKSTPKKFTTAVIDYQRIKGEKCLLMGNTNKTSVELIDWLYIRYRQIMPVDLMKKQDTIQTSYHVEEPIEILFD